MAGSNCTAAAQRLGQEGRQTLNIGRQTLNPKPRSCSQQSHKTKSLQKSITVLWLQGPLAVSEDSECLEQVAQRPHQDWGSSSKQSRKTESSQQSKQSKTVATVLLRAWTCNSVRRCRVSGPGCTAAAPRLGQGRQACADRLAGSHTMTMSFQQSKTATVLLHAGTSGSIRRCRVSGSGCSAATPRLGQGRQACPDCQEGCQGLAE